VAFGRWLALAATLQLGCQRPCGTIGTPLIFDLTSGEARARVKERLRPPLRWSTDEKYGGLRNAEPRFDFVTIELGVGEHLGQRGPVQVTFFNDRLNSVVFTPPDASRYFEAIARLPGGSVVEKEGFTIVRFAPHTEAWRVGASDNPLSVEWYDECLRQELISLIQEHSSRRSRQGGTGPQ
jgi:hypothetical protein